MVAISCMRKEKKRGENDNCGLLKKCGFRTLCTNSLCSHSPDCCGPHCSFSPSKKKCFSPSTHRGVGTAVCKCEVHFHFIYSFCSFFCKGDLSTRGLGYCIFYKLFSFAVAALYTAADHPIIFVCVFFFSFSYPLLFLCCTNPFSPPTFPPPLQSDNPIARTRTDPYLRCERVCVCVCRREARSSFKFSLFSSIFRPKKKNPDLFSFSPLFYSVFFANFPR